MNKRKALQYLCFNENGKTKLPLKSDLIKINNKGLNPEFFIDSCVCLHICNYIDKKDKANINKKRLINFKKYIQSNEININPVLGLMELCESKTGFDNEKFWDLFTRIELFKRIPLSNLKKMNFDSSKLDKTTFPNLSEKYEENIGMGNIFFNTYCALLKIRELCLINGTSKKVLRKNVIEFIEWLKNELGLFLAFELNLAFKIFGGKTNFKKMIWLEGKENLSKQKIKGSTWDILHSRLCTNNYEFSNLLGEPIYAHFITGDNNLFELFSNTNLEKVINTNLDKTTSLYKIKIDSRHFEDELIDEISGIMKKEFEERIINFEYDFNEKKIFKLIEDLELKNKIT